MDFPSRPLGPLAHFYGWAPMQIGITAETQYQQHFFSSFLPENINLGFSISPFLSSYLKFAKRNSVTAGKQQCDKLWEILITWPDVHLPPRWSFIWIKIKGVEKHNNKVASCPQMHFCHKSRIRTALLQTEEYQVTYFFSFATFF